MNHPTKTIVFHGRRHIIVIPSPAREIFELKPLVAGRGTSQSFKFPQTGIPSEARYLINYLRNAGSSFFSSFISAKVVEVV